METIVYNFLKSGHGKGACDGVGALTKRTADAAVANGQDVHDFKTLLRTLNNSNINCWFDSVSHKDIRVFKDQLHVSKMETFKGTLKVHQWIWCRSESLKIRFNKLSCYECSYNSNCKHYYLGCASLNGNSAD